MPDRRPSPSAVAAAGSRLPAPGPFIAVVGPSGAGKDTLISLAAEQLKAEGGFHFPRRVVTRAALSDAEDHDSLTPAQFATAQAAGAFCLTWDAHGLSYGLPALIPALLDQGGAVVANVSRRALQDAAESFRHLHVVEVTAPRHLLVQRIVARGRETPEEVELRLRRQVALHLPDLTSSAHRVENDRPIELAAADFLAILRKIRTDAPHGVAASPT